MRIQLGPYGGWQKIGVFYVGLYAVYEFLLHQTDLLMSWNSAYGTWSFAFLVARDWIQPLE